jgi:hypothetical protein
MVSERRLLKWAVLKKWTPRQGSPRNLGLAVAQLSVPIGILIAFGSPCHSRPNGSASEIRSTPRQKTLTETAQLSQDDVPFEIV